MTGTPRSRIRLLPCGIMTRPTERDLERARYRCTEEPEDDGPWIPCEVLLSAADTTLPGHVCAVTAHALTRRYAVLSAPTRESIACSGRLLPWSRIRLPDEPLERVAWLRWRWSWQWPLERDGGKLAVLARDLDIPWELVVSESSLPVDNVGVVVSRDTAAGDRVVLLGPVQLNLDGAVRHSEFIEPALQFELGIGRHGGIDTRIDAARAEAARLVKWYRGCLLGKQLTGMGRPPQLTFEQAQRAMSALLPAVRGRYELGTADSPHVRLGDLAAHLGCSSSTIHRLLKRHGLSFAEFRAQMSALDPDF